MQQSQTKLKEEQSFGNLRIKKLKFHFLILVCDYRTLLHSICIISLPVKWKFFLIQNSSLSLQVISQLVHPSLIHLFSMIISKESLHMFKDNYFCGPQKGLLFVLCTGWTSHLAQWGFDLDHIFYNSLTKINISIDHSFINTFIDLFTFHDCFLQRSSNCVMDKAILKLPYLVKKLHQTLR